ncbi:gamma-glutamyl-gamma-aminobutyrate hydrolase family protein [Arthrobacter globiformis]|uniref:gamma-glutamyl-gamma-aminobutyrate hydrolase family protein n=1 Tax=Arthrobacter globiformis TaxID=1665 RepID=UPI002782A750|nr:gamma-glutamyl-gamma-aminobutyrate hydrolase family protein [Arthrobacter globiformis]MDQ0864577.1 putative glutamine amidotransferase [Arthrobacter globiformis]
MTVAEQPAPRIAIPVRLGDSGAAAVDPRVEAARTIFNAVVGLIRESGAEPVLIEAGSDEQLEQALASCHGFVVPGGGDVDPSLYGGPEDHATLFGVDRQQDLLDAGVIRFALRNRLPFLGICRGMQLLNVVRGGTLHVHLEGGNVTHSVPPVNGLELSIHHVSLVEGTRCAAAYGSTPQIDVTSGHHQAVHDLGTGLRASAVAADGLVEAIETYGDDTWALGIQWHPEVPFLRDEARLPVFRALKAEADLILQSRTAADLLVRQV